jgi:hypothetical protein
VRSFQVRIGEDKVFVQGWNPVNSPCSLELGWRAADAQTGLEVRSIRPIEHSNGDQPRLSEWQKNARRLLTGYPWFFQKTISPAG